jgi:hypothetical protein
VRNLGKKWTAELVKLPESGMGYQRRDVFFADSRVARDVPVYNAEIAELPEELAALPIRRLHRTVIDV